MQPKKDNSWLVVSTPLKNISQIGSSSQLLGKIEHVPNHQPDSISWDNFLSMVFSHGTETVPFLVPQDNDWSAIFFVAVCAMVTGETVAVGVLVGLCQECDRFFAESGIFWMLQFKKLTCLVSFVRVLCLGVICVFYQLLYAGAIHEGLFSERNHHFFFRYAARVPKRVPLSCPPMRRDWESYRSSTRVGLKMTYEMINHPRISIKMGCLYKLSKLEVYSLYLGEQHIAPKSKTF